MMQENWWLLETPGKICRRVVQKIKGNIWLAANWEVDGANTRAELDDAGFWRVKVAFCGGERQMVPFDQLLNEAWTVDATVNVINELLELHRGGGDQHRGWEEGDGQVDRVSRRQEANALAQMKSEDIQLARRRASMRQTGRGGGYQQRGRDGSSGLVGRVSMRQGANVVSQMQIGGIQLAPQGVSMRQAEREGDGQQRGWSGSDGQAGRLGVRKGVNGVAQMQSGVIQLAHQRASMRQAGREGGDQRKGRDGSDGQAVGVRERQGTNIVAQMQRGGIQLAPQRATMRQAGCGGDRVTHWDLYFPVPMRVYADAHGLLRIHLSKNDLSAYTDHIFRLLTGSWILVGDGRDRCSDLMLVERIRWKYDRPISGSGCMVYFRWSTGLGEYKVCSLGATGKGHFV